MTLSIIIPLYNVEKYIEKCLLSCIKQEEATLGVDYEVVLVNDGSPDRSAQIAAALIKDKPGCRLINQENKGLGGARNTGLKEAVGDYIWFVDSDDWIAPDAVAIILAAISKADNPDILMFRAADVEGENLKIRQKEVENELTAHSGMDIFNQGGLQTCAPFQIIKKSLLTDNQLQFSEGLFHEDNEFMPKLAYLAQTVYQINDVLYFIFHNPHSITHTSNPRKAFDLIKVCMKLDSFLQAHQFDSNSTAHFSKFICVSLNNAIHQMASQPSEIRRDFDSELNKHSHLISHFRKSKSPRYLFEYLFFKVFRKYSAFYKIFS